MAAGWPSAIGSEVRDEADSYEYWTGQAHFGPGLLGARVASLSSGKNFWASFDYANPVVVCIGP
jgi:hypothetical protein